MSNASALWRAGMAEAVDLYHIKTHYFTAHPKLNYYAIVPVSLTVWERFWYHESERV